MKKNIVFIVKIEGESERSNPYHLSVESWKKWCKKNDCELFVLTKRIYDSTIMNCNWHKLFVFDLLDNEGIEYDQILTVDADTIIHPDSPNFFNLTDNKFCAVHNEGSYDWVLRSIENYSKHLFENYKFPFWKYINSGFIILNKSHKEFYKKIISFYFSNAELVRNIQKQFGVGTDQPIINFFLNKENIDYKILPYEFNMQDLARKEILNNELTFINLGWVYHYNAIPQRYGKPEEWMKKTYKHLYEN